MRKPAPLSAATEPLRDPAAAAAQARELERLTRAMQSLPDPCRQVLTLRKIYGLSQREIGLRLGLRTQEVESLLAEALLQCARVLGGAEQP